MTIFGVDVSERQNGMSLRQAAPPKARDVWDKITTPALR